MPPRTGVPTPGRPERVHHVHVERDVHVRGARDVLERAAHDGLHPEPVDLGDRVHEHLRAAQALALGRVERADADQHRALLVDRRRRPAAAREPLAAPPERAAQAHAVDVARGRRLRRVAVGVRVEPDRRDRPVHAREPAEDAERERVVATQHERQLAGAAARLDAVRDLARRR